MKTYQGYLPSGFQQSALTSSVEEPRRTSTSIHWQSEPLGKELKDEEVTPDFMNETLPGYDADQRLSATSPDQSSWNQLVIERGGEALTIVQHSSYCVPARAPPLGHVGSTGLCNMSPTVWTSVGRNSGAQQKCAPARIQTLALIPCQPPPLTNPPETNWW
jgi:hypothetical protein